MAERIPARLTAAEGRKFGLTVGIAFLVLAGVALWRGRVTTATVLGTLGGVLSVAGLVVPTLLGPVQRGWMGLAHQISRVTTPIFMGLVYFGIMTPAGLLRRRFGRPLGPPTDARSSRWAPHDGNSTRERMERQF